MSDSDYGPAPFAKLKDHLGIDSKTDYKYINKIISNKYYSMLNNNNL